MRAILYKFEGFIFGLLLALAACGLGIGIIEYLQYRELARAIEPKRGRVKYDASYADYFGSDKYKN